MFTNFGFKTSLGVRSLRSPVKTGWQPRTGAGPSRTTIWGSVSKRLQQELMIPMKSGGKEIPFFPESDNIQMSEAHPWSSQNSL
uniref:Uncharacterized protein n=1 Tax=Equus asinus asinus TaxID=83772 RepID=A0A8C4PQB7_EQUAS